MSSKILNKNLIVSLMISLFLFWPNLSSAISRTDTQAQLEQQLTAIEQEIADLQKQLTATTKQKNTLNNKIKELKIKQQELKALIKQTNLRINKLNGEIVSAEDTLKEILIKEVRLKDAIAVNLRLLQQAEANNIIVVLASGEGLSSILRQAFSYVKLTSVLDNLVEEIKITRLEIEKQKNILEDQKNSAVNLLQLKSAQAESLSGVISEQNSLLTKTKGLEQNYSQALSDSKKRAAEIRSRIYELFNTGTQINFGQALEIATFAGKLTGLKPAFLLAILTQESNLGKNVGTCNRKGDPENKSWKVIMKPERDHEPFKKITAELDLDIDITPVSCPMRDKNGKQVGWGGAMGPAQFIPSTWMGYKDKVSSLTGKSPADPWDIRDAFIASAIKLKAGGADGTDKNDWRAAMIYFSGGTNPAFSFYGDNVIALKKKYQADIDELSQ